MRTADADSRARGFQPDAAELLSHRPYNRGLMHAVVLAGGTGTRLWPLSRRDRPKPFLPLIGEESLFQRTLRRIEPLIPADDTLVVAEQGHLALVSEQAPQLLSRHLIRDRPGAIRPRRWAGGNHRAAPRQ